MRCPPLREIAAAVEKGEMLPALAAHVQACDACGEVAKSLRDETEGLSISIGDLWQRERISCPHKDLLMAFAMKSLDREQSEFIDFHINTVGCPACQAEASRAEDALDKKAPERVQKACEKSLHSTAVFLQKNARK